MAKSLGSPRPDSGSARDPKRPLTTPPFPVPHRSSSARRRWASLTAAAAVAALTLLALCHSVRKCAGIPPHQPIPSQSPPITNTTTTTTSQDETPFSWADIPPSRTLSWHPCYTTTTTTGTPSGLECARLDIPMDWLNPSDAHRVILAIIRLRATATPRRGPVFFNPGGPGGSGVWALRDHGRDLQAVVGEEFDIVSFDPRGVGASVPRVECWGGNRRQERAFWEAGEVGVLDAYPGVVYAAFARAAALSGVCEEDGGEILRHVGTTYHARDMLEVLEQMGERGLRYWGFSYGTVLGGTFAAMYPGRVERMVNDGNVDLKEWYQTVDYINFVRDTDKVVDAFYFYCHQAGPLRCAFHAATPGKIRQRLANLLAQIRINPVLVPSSPSESGPRMPELVTFTHVKRMLATALYQPIYRFQRVASVLAALEAGDGRPYHAYTSADQPASTPFCSSETTPPPSAPGPDEDTPDSFAAILCSDGEPFAYTPTTYESYVRAVQNLSTLIGGDQATTRLSCAGRTIRPKWRFAGPFSANTSFPVLFVNNIADNITPLVSARNNSAGFPGSVVLVQNSYGHTSLAAASSCTARAVRSYFREGRMPAEGTVCEADEMPFGEAAFPGAGGEGGAEVEESDALTEAVGRLSRGARWGVGAGL
ncbi:TAP-like protein-domain-containing protein [Cercophora newfieldiana]|uniref:TAP-like protein-domain-containing protein n=1 Tax=Cercophora newfieldiana TaxID=92897 RepID=A0AA39YQV7_9PEZI|nr:TAP-like protein-domain-containing protein [Cercophora newfieldiana]